MSKKLVWLCFLVGCQAAGLAPSDNAVSDAAQAADLAPRVSSNLPCSSDPLACPDGETCWPTGDKGLPLACQIAGTGQLGAPCEQGKVVTCDVGLVCGGIPLSGEQTTCLAYCHSDVDCGGGICRQVGVSLVETLVGICFAK